MSTTFADIPTPVTSRAPAAAPPREPAARMDLYVSIHKALRSFMTDTLSRIGRIDVLDRADRDAALAQLDELLGLCLAHLRHENDFVHTAIEARQPAGSQRIAAEHDEHLATIGALQAEADALRTAIGADAERLALRLYRHLALFVAENSRIVVSKLEFDPQSQARQSFVHLAVGKVRAVVSQAAVTLVKARQSNFAVTTPTAVAAARGTVFEVVYDATQNVMRVAVIVKDPQRAAGLVSCTSLYDRFSNVLVREGLATSASGTSGCTPPIPISMLPDANLVGTLQNPIRPGPAFSVPVTVPSVPGSPAPGPVVFSSDPGDAPPAPPSTIGANIGNLPSQGTSSVPVAP